MARRSKQPSRTDVRNSLRLSEFDPRESGTPLSIAIEERDPSYCEMKAQELIREARACAAALAGADVGSATEKSNLEWYNEKITRAVSLLAYARVLRNESVHS